MSVTAISLEDLCLSNCDKMSKQFEHTVSNVNTSVVVGGGSSSSSSPFSSKIGLLSGPASPMPCNDEAIRASTIITTIPNALNSYHSGYPSPHHHNYHHHQYHSQQQKQQQPIGKRPKTPPSTSHQQLENASKIQSSNLLTATTITGAATAPIKITPPSQSKITTATTSPSANIFQQRDISDATKTTTSTVVGDEAHQRELLEGEIGELKAERNFLHQQFADAQRREKILMRRLANKEQEFQDYVTQIAAYKAAQAPTAATLRSALLDPAVNILFEKLKKELKATKARLEETQNELAAWKFTPDSNTGKRLMAKCRLLYQENEELGKMTSNGRLAKLETELAMQKSFSEEVKKSQSELEDFLQELDEDVEGMQSTILFLQQELKTTRARIEALEKENYQLRAGCNVSVYQGLPDEQQQQPLQQQQQQVRKNKPFKMETTEDEEKVSSLESIDNSNVQVVHESSSYNGPVNISIKSSSPLMHVGNSVLQTTATTTIFGADKLLTKECKAGENTFISPLIKKNINNSNNSNPVYNITEDSMQETQLLIQTAKINSLELTTTTSAPTASSTTTVTNAYDAIQKDVNISEVVISGKLRTVASRKRNYEGITSYDNVLSGGGFGGNNGVGGVSGASSNSGTGPNTTPSPRILPPKKSKLRVPPTSRSAIPIINEYDVLTVTPITGGTQASTNIITPADTIISNHVNHHSNHEIEMVTIHETFDSENMNLHHHQQQTNDGIMTQRIITRRRSVRLNGVAPNGSDAI